MNDYDIAADVALNTVAAFVRSVYKNDKDGARWLATLNDLVELGLAREIAGDLAHRFRANEADE